MKMIMILLLMVSFNLQAQTEPTPESPNLDQPGTLVPPTAQQKATVKNVVKNAAKKAKKSDAQPKVTDAQMIESATMAPAAASAPAPELAAAATESAAAENKKPASNSSSEPHRFGLHADVNAPHILNYGLDYAHPSDWFSGAINFGGYALSGLAKSSDVPNGLDIKIANQELMLRVHPLRGSFYLGLGYGNHTINVETKQRITVTSPAPGSANVEISDEIKANYLLPHIGWGWRLPLGLTFGFDLGFLSPMSPQVELKSKVSNISNPAITSGDVESTQEYQNARRDIIEKSEQAGKAVLPYFTVFRIGWLF